MKVVLIHPSKEELVNTMILFDNFRSGIIRFDIF